jgi:hypothetical protein
MGCRGGKGANDEPNKVLFLLAAGWAERGGEGAILAEGYGLPRVKPLETKFGGLSLIFNVSLWQSFPC